MSESRPPFHIDRAHWDQDQKQLIELRSRVFIHEQGVPEALEIDGKDPSCLHVKALNTDGEFIATARLLPDHYIGRMCVLKPWRRQGIGSQMLAFLIDHANSQGLSSLMLNAQLEALPFYQGFGFVADSEVFIEADIAHVHMTLCLAK